MSSNQQLNFLQEKIKEINSAIFFNLSDSVLKLPTSLVNTLKVDDFGYVWLLFKKPKQHLQEFENGFPVRLDYFKKGSTCFLQIMGKAWVVTDPEEVNTYLELNDDVHFSMLEDNVLVKVKMLKAEYYETQARTKNTIWHQAINMVTTLFRSPNSIGPSTYFPAS
ncbi:MAG TPA: pyridoxamine 5'-phosphate oxidase family protein [Chitinophagaceae bacterium]|nr:pyridoxamine 5'-phosphate oxidase family protein [Chitinophagaceae bacterium]